MFYNVLSEIGGLERIIEILEILTLSIEVLAVIFIVSSVFFNFFRYIYERFRMVHEEKRYRNFRHGLGRSLLLGLEMLIAADIARTVALEASLASISVLGLLVLIRTFLSWSIVVEIEGRWPWQANSE